MVATAARQLADGSIAVASVVGFLSGARLSAVKTAEARAVTSGANELDVVIDLGGTAAGRWDRVASDIAAVRDVAPRPVVLKVLESGLWSQARLAPSARRGGAAWG